MTRPANTSRRAPGGRVLPAGPTAVLLELAPGASGDSPHRAVAALAAAVRERARRGELAAVDVVPGARTVLVDGIRPGDTELLGWLLDETSASPEADRTATAGAAGPPLELPTVYDGPDLAEVAGLWGVDTDTVIARHAGLEFSVAFCGFAPGFAYLAGLPAAWSVPRRGQSRPRVPAGSVGLAGTWCGVYPRASPGGWQLLGRTAVPLFDPAAAEPALLAPGRRVRFVAATR